MATRQSLERTETSPRQTGIDLHLILVIKKKEWLTSSVDARRSGCCVDVARGGLVLSLRFGHRLLQVGALYKSTYDNDDDNDDNMSGNR